MKNPKMAKTIYTKNEKNAKSHSAFVADRVSSAFKPIRTATMINGIFSRRDFQVIFFRVTFILWGLSKKFIQSEQEKRGICYAS